MKEVKGKRISHSVLSSGALTIQTLFSYKVARASLTGEGMCFTMLASDHPPLGIVFQNYFPLSEVFSHCCFKAQITPCTFGGVLLHPRTFTRIMTWQWNKPNNPSIVDLIFISPEIGNGFVWC